MPQQALQREHIGLLPQKLNRKRMPKPVHRRPMHSCSIPDPLHQPAQSVAAQTVSLKMAPEHHTVVKAMALGQGMTVSGFLREMIQKALDLDRQMERLASVFSTEAPGYGEGKWGAGR
jgi:hypothetical protein